MATTASQPPPPPPPPLPPQSLPINFLPFIDMTTLSQSELQTIALSSTSHLHLNDVVPPTIDRSTFNESAGSRRQTYSRSASSSSSHHHHRHHHHRVSSLFPNPSHNPIPSTNDDTDRAENRSIVSFLKELLSAHPDFQQPDYLDFDIFNNFNSSSYSNVNNDPVNHSYLHELPPAVGGSFVRKMKRGRKPKVKGLGAAGIGLEIVNRNGVAVNIVELASLEDPYKEELRRRTAGMAKEEELLGFFTELGGQWCSRRRKRKIVDACEFGDFLPVGWKLLLGLKRKEGRAWVYCRRYISPGGIQLISCKDAAAYLQSFFGPYDGQPAKDHASSHLQQDDRVASENLAVAMEVEEDSRQANGLQREIGLLEFENLAEVEIHDLFQCHKCNMNFDEKDAYLQHLLSLHQGTTRRYKLGSSVGDGNKIDVQKSSDAPSKVECPAKISKMDALIEIAQHSILETSGTSDERNGGFSSEKLKQISVKELSASTSDHDLLDYDSPFSNPEMKDELIENPVEVVFYPHDGDYGIFDTKKERVDDSGLGKSSSSANAQCDGTSMALGVKGNMPLGNDQIDKFNIDQRISPAGHSIAMSNQNNEADNNVSSVATEESFKQPKPDELDNTKDNEIKIGFGANVTVVQNDNLQESFQESIKDVNQHKGPEQHISVLPSHNCPSSNRILNKEEKSSGGSINQRHVKPTGFEELRSEGLEQSKLNFGAAQESLSQPLTAVESQMEEVARGAQFDPQVALGTTEGSKLVTMCMWCGVEFSYEALDSEIQSDSVGYMCPTCKARIS